MEAYPYASTSLVTTASTNPAWFKAAHVASPSPSAYRWMVMCYTLSDNALPLAAW